MKSTFIQLLETLLEIIDMRIGIQSSFRFEVKQMLLTLKRKQGPISQSEIDRITTLMEQVR